MKGQGKQNLLFDKISEISQIILFLPTEQPFVFSAHQIQVEATE